MKLNCVKTCKNETTLIVCILCFDLACNSPIKNYTV